MGKNVRMRRVVTLLIVLLIGIGIGSMSACSNLDRYRYPCQDPKNFDSSDCRSPVCDVDRTCTDDLIGRENQP